MRLPILLSLLIVIATGCTTVPHTGRSALHLVPEGQLEADAALQFNQLKQQTPISNDPTYNAMLRRVGERIADVATPDMPTANPDWEFVVFEDDSQLNAFAMPGGKVAVYTGLFRIADTDDHLAVVVGHEIAHVVARHGNERVSQQMAAGLVGAGLAAGTQDMDSTERAAILAAYGAGASLGVLLPYSRTHESEADRIGLIYSARAGYNPVAAIEFWQRMEAESGGKAPPEFLSTHPAGSTRVNNIKRQLPEVMPLYRAARNNP